MIKVIGKNSIHFIGKVKEIKLQLASASIKDMTLADYIKQQTQQYRNSLN